MIYRKRISKTGYSVKLTRLHLKIELGKRVWYFKVLGVGKPWHKTLTSIKDVLGVETVSHTRLRNRVTVYRTA